jgi:hypothetical protein
MKIVVFKRTFSPVRPVLEISSIHSSLLFGFFAIREFNPI